MFGGISEYIYNYGAPGKHPGAQIYSMEEANMSVNVETMFYVREEPWHGLGTEVQEAPASTDALVYAGLNWLVEQKDVYTEDGWLIPGYKANIRSSDDVTPGIVSEKYKGILNYALVSERQPLRWDTVQRPYQQIFYDYHRINGWATVFPAIQTLHSLIYER